MGNEEFVYKNSHSNISIGVPQGTVLGSLLFLINVSVIFSPKCYNDVDTATFSMAKLGRWQEIMLKYHLTILQTDLLSQKICTLICSSSERCFFMKHLELNLFNFLFESNPRKNALVFWKLNSLWIRDTKSNYLEVMCETKHLTNDCIRQSIFL